MSFWNTHTWCSSHALNLNDSGLVFHLISDPLTTSKPSLNHPWSILEPSFHHHLAIISPWFQPQLNHHLNIKACKKNINHCKINHAKKKKKTFNHQWYGWSWGLDPHWQRRAGGALLRRRLQLPQAPGKSLGAELAFSCLRKVAEFDGLWLFMVDITS